jgi:pimeloyl-ACP methyl ester carboxylesterase
MKNGPRPRKPADARFLEGLSAPDPMPAWLTPDDLNYYVGEFEKSGFRGPLNRYRTSQLDFAQQAAIADKKIEQPAAFIAGTLDPVLSFVPGVDLIALMRERVTDLRLVRLIDGVGHWVQQERPAEVNAALKEWLAGLG